MVGEMLKCVAVVSANDCAVALGEHLAGSEESFVAMMNARAKELGMENTHFVNACGLTAEGHLTSAYDIGLMSAKLMVSSRNCGGSSSSPGIRQSGSGIHSPAALSRLTNPCLPLRPEVLLV